MQRWPWILTGTCLLAGSSFVFAQDERPRRTREAQAPAIRFDIARMLSQFDKNNDGSIDEDEAPPQLKQRFKTVDADGNGKLSKAELENMAGRLGNRPQRPNARPQPEAAPGQPDNAASPDGLFRLLDTDRDGKLSKEELENAVKLMQRDRNKDGVLEPNELAGPNDGRRPGEVITPAAKGERHSDTLKVGDEAPDFTLPDKSGKNEVTLSSFRGKRPVVLIFASYT